MKKIILFFIVLTTCINLIYSQDKNNNYDNDEKPYTKKELLQAIKKAKQKAKEEDIRPTLFGSASSYGDKGVNFDIYENGRYKAAAERGNWSGAAGTVHNLEELADAEQGYFDYIEDIFKYGTNTPYYSSTNVNDLSTNNFYILAPILALLIIIRNYINRSKLK